MFNIGGGEVLVILFIALLVLGPARLPGAARQVGRALAEFRRVTGNVQSDLREAFDTDELREGVATLKQVTNLGATVRSELVSAATTFASPFASGTTSPSVPPDAESLSATSGTIVAPPDGLYADDLPAPSTAGAQIATPNSTFRDVLTDPVLAPTSTSRDEADLVPNSDADSTLTFDGGSNSAEDRIPDTAANPADL